MQLEVLLWWLPPVVVTVVAALWVSWIGREGRGEVDREEAVRRLGEALEGRRRGLGRLRRTRRTPGYAVVATPRERSSGVAVRRPVPGALPETDPAPGPAAELPSPATDGVERRRAS